MIGCNGSSIVQIRTIAPILLSAQNKSQSRPISKSVTKSSWGLLNIRTVETPHAGIGDVVLSSHIDSIRFEGPVLNSMPLNLAHENLDQIGGRDHPLERAPYQSNRKRSLDIFRATALSEALLILGTLTSQSRASSMTEQAAQSESPPSSTLGDSLPVVTVQSQSYWYGWQVLIVGEAGGAFLSAGLATHNVPSAQTWRTALLFPVGLTSFVLGDPLVHWSNDNFHKGLISLGMNVTIPVITGVVGGSVACSRPGASASCRSNGFFDSTAVAVLGVPLLDAAILAWGETVTERAITTSAVPWQDFSPFVQLGLSGQTLFGFSGRF